MSPTIGNPPAYVGNPMPSMATDTPTKIDAGDTFFQLFIFFFARIDCFTFRFTFSFSISEASISSSSFRLYQYHLIVHKCLSYCTTSKTNIRSILL